MGISTDPRIGSELLGYRVEALVGRGGMGVVYRAYDSRLKRNVALKLVAPELSEDERFRERFLAETELAASLEHPNVVPIHDAGEVEGQLYLAMRYVAGSDLKTLLQVQGALEPKRALAICAQIADALDAAHERGLVHRDVKPSNVLLDSHEHVYLADFGLTRRLAEHGLPAGAGLSLGTPAYVSPEQIEGGEVDGRADLYSLGCLLYECLAGQVPFARDSELSLLWAHVQEQPPRASERNSDLPEAIDAVIAKALAKDPDDRYSSCRELVEAARDAPGVRDVVILRDRRPLLLLALGALALAGALAAGLVLTLSGSGSRKADLTVRNNALVRIDTSTNKIASVTKVGQLPASVAVGGRIVWVYNWNDRTVSAIDARTDTVERTVSISGFPPAAPEVTSPISIAADGGGAWVLSGTGGNGILTHLQPGLLPTEFFFPYDPLAVAVGEHAVWVAAKDIRGSAVLRISPRTGAVLSVARLRGAVLDEAIMGSGARDVHSIGVGAGAVWAAQGGTIFRIDPASVRITGSKDFPHREVSQVAPDGGGVWAVVSDPARGNLLVRIDPRTLQRTETIRQPNVPGSGAGALALGEGSLWWNGTRTGIVWRVDPRAKRIVSTTLVTPQDRSTGRTPRSGSPMRSLRAQAVSG